MAQLPDDVLREIASTLPGCRVVDDKARDGSFVFWLVADAPGYGVGDDAVKPEQFHGAGGNNRVILGSRILAVIESHRGWPVYVDHYHADDVEGGNTAQCTRWAHHGPQHDPNISRYDPDERLTEKERAKRLDHNERLKESTPIDTPEKLKEVLTSLIEGSHGASYDQAGHSKQLLGVAERHRARAGRVKNSS